VLTATDAIPKNKTNFKMILKVLKSDLFLALVIFKQKNNSGVMTVVSIYKVLINKLLLK
jgi:hypothetical protein